MRLLLFNSGLHLLASTLVSAQLRFDPCPISCNEPSSQWTIYHDLAPLERCNQTVVFNMLYAGEPLDIQQAHGTLAIQACALPANFKRSMADMERCPTAGVSNFAKIPSETQPQDFTVARWGTPDSKHNAAALDALSAIKTVVQTSGNCQLPTTSFIMRSPVVAAIWSGALVEDSSVASHFLDDVIDHIKGEGGVPATKIIQACPDGNPAKSLGVVINTENDVAKVVQSAVKQWSQGACVSSQSSTTSKLTSQVAFAALPSSPTTSDNNSTFAHFAMHKRKAGHCRTTQVHSGDTCAALAAKCHISGHDFDKYNPGICSKLVPGGYVCCSAGKKPDLRPKPKPNGTCFSYKVQGGDWCAKIAAPYGLTAADIEKFNKKTYGWRGCKDLGLHLTICLSSGKPPRPTVDPNAECGPTAPAKHYNKECPIKACCSDAGYCGIDEAHCKVKKSPTNNPGTKNCFSNCDFKYVKGDPPSDFKRIGYFESWSISWKCMNKGVDGVDFSPFTHVHFAFADINNSMKVVMDGNATKEWGDFKALSDVKKIVSFGGWGISTDVSTYSHLRNAMKPKNVDKFVDSLIKFINDNDLDGVDIDWEYPGEPDIEGIPPGSPNDGPNYLAFLKALRKKIPKNKSMSIAAPASYWYLKQFPIADMAKEVDYIVYMTYDFHGQWDFKNRWTGPFLKSHVNWTETEQALALITHAGVPSNKVLLGEAGYGRSFQQTNPSCYKPECTFTGPDSGAEKGPCTNTAGYISYVEILNITSDAKRVRKTYVDAGSTITLYDKDQWVAYVTADQNNDRTMQASSMNLGGTVKWAADLEGEAGIYEIPPEVIEDILLDKNRWYIDNCGDYKGWKEIPDSASKNSDCDIYGTANALHNMAKDSMSLYDDLVSKDYVKTFSDYYQPAIYGNMSNYYYKWMFGLLPDQIMPRRTSSSASVASFAASSANSVSVADYLGASNTDSPGLLHKRDANGGKWDEYLGWKSTKPDQPGHVTIYEDMYFKDEAGFYKAVSDYMGQPLTKESFIFDLVAITFKAPCTDPRMCHRYGFSYTWFPILNMAVLVPDPMLYIKNNYTQIQDFISNMEDDLSIGFSFPGDIIGGSLYPVMSVDNAVNAMNSSYTIGHKIKDMEEEERRKSIIDLVLGFVFMAFAFVPGGEFIAAIAQVALAAAMGDTNPVDYIMAGADAIGSVYKFSKSKRNFADMSDAVSEAELKRATKGKKTMSSSFKDTKTYKNADGVVTRMCKK